MNKLIKTSICCLGLSILSACSHHHNGHWDHDEDIGHSHQISSQNSWVNWQTPSHIYRPQVTHKLLSDYTEVMAMKLIESMRYVTGRSPVAVTSFVELDNNLQTTNVLGNQLAESFTKELQQFGLSVVDVHHMGKVNVTPNGDFTLTRKGQEVGNIPKLDYVLAGTLTYNDRGVIVNTRIIGVHSKVVVATADGFIPHFVVESLYSSKVRDGINISSL